MLGLPSFQFASAPSFFFSLNASGCIVAEGKLSAAGWMAVLATAGRAAGRG